MSLTNIKNKVTSIWSYTEMEMSDYSKAGLKKHIEKISEIVDDVIRDIEELKSCTICSYEVCDECGDEMAKQYGE